MFFRQFLHEERACLSYMIGCPTKGLCAVIDPLGEAEHYIRHASQHGMTISHILETHIQADHISGAQELHTQTGAPIYLGLGSEVNYQTISTVGHERRNNSALKMSEEDFIRYQMENHPPLPVDFEAIKSVNLGHNH